MYLNSLCANLKSDICNININFDQNKFYHKSDYNPVTDMTAERLRRTWVSKIACKVY